MKEPDSFEKSLRFGCGFVFGLFIGFLVAAQSIYHSLGWLATITFIVGVAFGLLAMRYGDKFWYSIKKWDWWT
jgi:hypothetical protein